MNGFFVRTIDLTSFVLFVSVRLDIGVAVCNIPAVVVIDDDEI